VTAVFRDSQPHGNPSTDMTGAFERLELDIDLRLADLWRCADEHDGPWTIELLASYIRAAYGKGYCDSLGEAERGALCIEHGFDIPEPPPPAAKRHLTLVPAPAAGPLARRGITASTPRAAAA
jgi:hypothetical protein